LPSTKPDRRGLAAVFLDLGNVLAFHDDAVLFRRMSAWGGADPETIRRRMLALWDPINRGTLAGDELRQAVCRAAGREAPMAEDDFFALWNCHFRIHREILPLVDALLDRAKVLLLSNTNERHWRFIRPLVPQFARFAGLVVSYELCLAKPDPEIYRIALDRAGVAPAEAAYFDDVPLFVDAACAQGIAGRIFTDAPAFRAQLAELGLAV
jgi:putative hydrolase of the HAD superfamily